jgi:hypothetical protein
MTKSAWYLSIVCVVAFLYATAHPVAIPANCEGKTLCLFITE